MHVALWKMFGSVQMGPFQKECALMGAFEVRATPFSGKTSETELVYMLGTYSGPLVSAGDTGPTMETKCHR